MLCPVKRDYHVLLPYNIKLWLILILSDCLSNTGLAKIDGTIFSKQWKLLKQIYTNLQIIILLDNFVMTSGKILKRGLLEIVFMY